MKWLCVAHEKEIPDFDTLAVDGWQAHAIGIGQYNALMRFTELLLRGKPEAVILAGTCGSANKADIMRTWLCHHFAFPAVQGEEVPEFLEQNFSTIPGVVPAGLAAATVLQNYGVSLDARKFMANAEKIPPAFPRPVLENMEAAAIALACKRAGVPFAALLCVTNEIGPTARVEWKQNFRAAGEELKRRLAELFAARL